MTGKTGTMGRRRTIFNPAIWGPVLLAGLRMLFTRHVPWYCKALVLAAVGYALFPIDLIPDIPVLGWGDDVAVVLGLLSLALSLIPKGVLRDNPMEKKDGESATETMGGKPEVVADVPAVEGVGKDESGARGR